MFDSKKFETQVQEKLHGLDLSPSPAVWDKIEAQLPPENRRRIAKILWSTLLVAAVSAGGYFFFINTKTISDKANNSTLSVKTPANTLNNNKVAESGNINRSESKGDELKQLQASTADQTKTAGVPANNENLSIDPAASVKTEPSAAAAHKQEIFNKTGSPLNVVSGAAGASKRTAISNKIKTDVVAGSKDQPIAARKSRTKNGNGVRGNVNRSKDDNIAEPGTTDEPVDKLADRQSAGIKSGDVLEEETIQPSVVNGDIGYHSGFKVDASVKELAKAATVTPLKNRKRWSVEIGASGGQSIYSEGKVKKLFTAADAAVLNTNIPPTYFTPTASYVPSEIKPGKSFSVGADARYKINKRLSVTAGAYYSLLTTKMETGRKVQKEKRVDMNGSQRQISEFYSAGYSNDYTNNYHFIEIPVLLHLQLNKGRKLPLYLNAGFSYSKLFKTNALHYDATAGIYYKASELVKKDFLNVEGGVSARLFPSKWYSIIIGPEIQYGVTNLFRNNVPQNDKHSLFLGIKASYPLNL